MARFVYTPDMNTLPASYERVGFKALLAGERALLKRFDAFKTSAYGYKAHHEIVTAADNAANRAILSVLRAGTPDFDILSEEGSPRTKSDWRWIVDPLDGTTNFAARLPLWGVSIALEHRGDVVLGLLSLPRLGERYVARRGGGAWRLPADGRPASRGIRIRASKTGDLREALGLLCFGYDKPHKVTLMHVEPALVYRSRSLRLLGAAVVEAAWVATGRADYAVLSGIRPWDAAAGALLVREAGAKALTMDGKEWSIRDKSIVYVTPKLERTIVAASRKL